MGDRNFLYSSRSSKPQQICGTRIIAMECLLEAIRLVLFTRRGQRINYRPLTQRGDTSDALVYKRTMQCPRDRNRRCFLWPFVQARLHLFG